MIRRNNRRNPNTPLIDGQVATDSNTMERGINATAAPTMRGSVLDSLNMDVAEDGGMVIRDPLILKHRVKRSPGVSKTRLLETHVKHIMLYVEDNKLYLIDTSNRDNTPQSFNIIWFDRYNNSHTQSSESPLWQFGNIEVTSTGTSTLISNVSFVPNAFDDMEVYQDSSISVFRIMRLELDSQTGNFLKCTLLQPITPNISVGDDFSYNPNTYHDYPYALRDAYNTEVISTLGIVSYMLGTENADKTEFTPYKGHATAAALYTYLKNNNFKVRDITEMNINHLNALGTFRPIVTLADTDKTRPIVLKAFLSFPNADLPHLKYMGIWEKTYDGVTWEAISTSGRSIPKVRLLVDKENLIDASDAQESTEVIIGERLNYADQYDSVESRADIITVIPDGASYRFRVFQIPLDIIEFPVRDVTIFDYSTGEYFNPIYTTDDVTTYPAKQYPVPIDYVNKVPMFFTVLDPDGPNTSEFAYAPKICIRMEESGLPNTILNEATFIYLDSEGNRFNFTITDFDISASSSSFYLTLKNIKAIKKSLGGIYKSFSVMIKFYIKNTLVRVIKTAYTITRKAQLGTHQLKATPGILGDTTVFTTKGNVFLNSKQDGKYKTYVTGKSGSIDFSTHVPSDLDNPVVSFSAVGYYISDEQYQTMFNAVSDVNDRANILAPEIRYKFTLEDSNDREEELNYDFEGLGSNFYSYFNATIGQDAHGYINYTLQRLKYTYVGYFKNGEVQLLPYILSHTSDLTYLLWGKLNTITGFPDSADYKAIKNANTLKDVYTSSNLPPFILKYDLNVAPEDFIEQLGETRGVILHSIVFDKETEVLLNNLPNVAKGKFRYYKKSLYAYGHIDFQNNVYVSNANSFEFPLFNVIDLNTPASNIATAIVPWRDYLIITTETSVFMVSGSAPSFIITLVNGFIGVPLKDGPTVKAILNGIIFKSGEKVFTLQPSVYSAADNTLYIQEISTPVNRYLQLFNTGDTSFGIVTDRHYILFSGTNALKFDLNQKIWTRHSFPNPVHNVLYTSVSDNYIISENQDVTGDTFAYIAHYGRKLQDFIGDSEEDKRLPHIDYLNYFDEYDIMDILKDNSIAIRIPFKVNFGQKTSNMALIKQFVESKITFRLSSTDSRQDAFEIKLDVYTDENKKPIHVIATTDGKLLQEIEYGLVTPVDVKYVGVLNTDFQDTSDVSADVDTTLKQIVVRHSGKGKSIQHIISGESAYNFKIYVIYYKYKIVPIHH